MADATTTTTPAAASAAPHLDDGVVSEILHRLPSKEAYRIAGAVCPRWRDVVSQPTFLSRHLSPGPLLLLGDCPYAFVVQPRGKVGFSHLTLVAIDPADDVGVRVPVQRRYMDRPPPLPRQGPSRRPPPPALLETATEKSVFRLLYSTGTDVDDEEEDVSEDPEDDDAADDEKDVAVLDDAEPADPTPAPLLESEQLEDPVHPPDPADAPDDYVVFFERTVPMLNISFVASHGRLLLGCSPSRYYVCDPAANRWLVLPPSTIAPIRDPNCGLHYDRLRDASTGRIAFTVVLLVRCRNRRGLVETFSSATGRWDVRELAAQGVARCIGAASPGIHVGSSFYWLSRRKGGVLRYEATRCRASVLREPPEAEGSTCRLGRSLGSVGRQLRLCAFDLRDEHHTSMLPHDGLDGVHGVWMLMDADGPWRRVHESVVGDISTWYFLTLFGHETPVDFAGACGDFIVVDKDPKHLLRYDLESGSKVQLASLYTSCGGLGALYRRYHAFAFFK